TGMPAQAFRNFRDLACLRENLLKNPRLCGTLLKGCQKAFSLGTTLFLFPDGQRGNLWKSLVEWTPGHLELDFECNGRDFRTEARRKSNRGINSRERCGLAVRSEGQQQILEGHCGVRFK